MSMCTPPKPPLLPPLLLLAPEGAGGASLLGNLLVMDPPSQPVKLPWVVGDTVGGG